MRFPIGVALAVLALAGCGGEKSSKQDRSKARYDGSYVASKNKQAGYETAAAARKCVSDGRPEGFKDERMLEKGMSLEEIAENLNHAGIRTPHGTPKWSAAKVRQSFVS